MKTNFRCSCCNELTSDKGKAVKWSIYDETLVMVCNDCAACMKRANRKTIFGYSAKLISDDKRNKNEK